VRKDWKVCGFKVTAVVLWWEWVSMRSLIKVAVRSSLILKCMLKSGMGYYLVKYARVSRMPDITLSFNASDD
jgi:hypothetical protein